MGRSFFFKLFVFIPLTLMSFSFLQSCASNSKFSSGDGDLLKNWDTVNKKLNYYIKKSADEVFADFGNEYELFENDHTFTASIEDDIASITFVIKKEKVSDYYYSGSYKHICMWLDTIPKLKNSEIQTAAECWLGYSPDLLKESFDSLVYSSTDKLIRVGPSENNCIEYTVAAYTQAAPTNSTGTKVTVSSPGAKLYIKKVEVNGTYAVLKDYLVPLPKDSIPVKKVKQKN